MPVHKPNAAETKSKQFNSTSIKACAWQTKMAEKLDNYEIENPDDEKIIETPEESQARVNLLLQNKQTALSTLYQNEIQSTNHRENFLEKLSVVHCRTDNQHDLKGKDDRADNPEGHLITLEKLLGKDGLKSYKAAIEEESKSQNFRNDVFLK